MILPLEIIDEVKQVFGSMGVVWSDEIEANDIRPVCTGKFRGGILAVYKDGSELGEILCVSGNKEEFENVLKLMIEPEVEE